MKKFFCPPCLIGLISILIVFGGYFLLRGGYQAPTPAPTAPASEEVTTPEKEVVAPPVVKKLTVSGTEYSFEPSSITVSVGERVKIIFRNEGRAPHNLIVEGLEVGTKTVGSGQTDILEFTAPTSGTYTTFCSVSGHRAAGMEGTLEVE